MADEAARRRVKSGGVAAEVVGMSRGHIEAHPRKKARLVSWQVLTWEIAAGLAVVWAVIVRPQEVGGALAYGLITVYVASVVVMVALVPWPTKHPTDVPQRQAPVASERAVVPVRAGGRVPGAPVVAAAMADPPVASQRVVEPPVPEDSEGGAEVATVAWSPAIPAVTSSAVTPAMEPQAAATGWSYWDRTRARRQPVTPPDPKKKPRRGH